VTRGSVQIKILNLCNPHRKKTPANQQQQRGFRLLASPLFAFMPPSYSHRLRRTTTVTNNPNVVAIVLSQTIIDFQNIRDEG
jgi:hypothetical protein